MLKKLSYKKKPYSLISISLLCLNLSFPSSLYEPFRLANRYTGVDTFRSLNSLMYIQANTLIDENIQYPYNQRGLNEVKYSTSFRRRRFFCMVDGFIENNTFQDNPYTITEPDTLGVLSSTRWVVEHASHAWINKEQVGHVCLQLLAKYTPAIEPVWYDRFHFHDGTERTVNWLLVLDALNFCFWAEKGQPR